MPASSSCYAAREVGACDADDAGRSPAGHRDRATSSRGDDVLQTPRTAAQYSLSATGSLVYVRRRSAAAARNLLVWVDRQGKEQSLPAPVRAYLHPTLSPDAQRVSVTIGSDEGPEANIWVDDLARNSLTKLTFQRYANFGFWTPDGKRVTFMLTNESAAQFSPDGHWLAYASDESGREEIYVRPYPGPGGKWQLSTDGGIEARWSRSGRELFYRRGNAMMAVDVTTQSRFTAGTPPRLFEGPYVPTARGLPNYDVSHDGQRFLMVKASGEAPVAATQINVVLNWSEELKRKVPAGSKK